MYGPNQQVVHWLNVDLTMLRMFTCWQGWDASLSIQWGGTAVAGGVCTATTCISASPAMFMLSTPPCRGSTTACAASATACTSTWATTFSPLAASWLGSPSSAGLTSVASENLKELKIQSCWKDRLLWVMWIRHSHATIIKMPPRLLHLQQ